MTPSATDWQRSSSAPWPDWKDAGRRIAIRLEDGQEFEGELYLEDFAHDGQGEEYPIWGLVLADGTRRTFVDNYEWRFLS
jgi:hypothetical protein